MPLNTQRDTVLDGALNASMVLTDNADLYCTTMADMLLLGFIQIGRVGTQNGHSGNSSHLNGTDSHITGQTSFRLVLTLVLAS